MTHKIITAGIALAALIAAGAAHVRIGKEDVARAELIARMAEAAVAARSCAQALHRAEAAAGRAEQAAAALEDVQLRLTTVEDVAYWALDEVRSKRAKK